MSSLSSAGMASEKGLSVVRFTCDCGAPLVVKQDREGDKVKCPQCSRRILVEPTETQFFEPPTESVSEDEYVRYYCICGKPLKNHITLVGKPVKCPTCDTVVSVPKYSTRRNVVDKFIKLVCHCRKEMRVAHWHRGQNVKCPHCQKVLQVPDADPGSTIDFEGLGGE